MKTYHVKGEIRIEYAWLIDEEVEAENEDDAIEAICDELDPSDSYDNNTDIYSLKVNEKVNEVEAREEPTEAQRMIALGHPMLPGF